MKYRLLTFSKSGYRKVGGVELNEERRFIATLTTGWPIHKTMPESTAFDLVYTMACLEHVPDIETFQRIGAQPHANLFTVEGEIKAPSERHFPRNYQAVFEPLGWKQVEQWDNIPGLGHPCYIGRWFVRA